MADIQVCDCGCKMRLTGTDAGAEGIALTAAGLRIEVAATLPDGSRPNLRPSCLVALVGKGRPATKAVKACASEKSVLKLRRAK